MDKLEAFVHLSMDRHPVPLTGGKKGKCPKLAKSMNGSVRGALHAAPLACPLNHGQSRK
nr:MAG TPA: hypothetical protein [Caudoviricetes sp.]